MKKIFIITMLVCSLSQTAFAESVVDYKTDTVTISGEAEGRVGITVFCPDMWFEDITGDVFSNDVISHNMQTTSSKASEDDESTYSFSFKQKDETGLYRYLVNSDTGDTEEGSFVYVDTTDRQTIVDALNGASEAEISGICETYKFELEIGDTIITNADKTTVAKIIADCINESPFDVADFRKVSDTVKSAYQAGVIAAGKVTNLTEIKDVYSFVDSGLDEWMSSTKITDLRKKAIISALKGNYTSFKGLSDKFIEKLVLYVVEQPNGLSNLKKVIADFDNEIGVDVTKLTDSKYNAVSGTLYSSLSALKTALTPQTPSGTQGGNNGGNGGGGGGGGATKPSDKNNAPSVVIGGGTTGVTNTTTAPIMKFEDIDSVPWAYEAIASLAKDGVVSGKSETVFDPMGNVTREEFVKMLVGVLKLDVVVYTGGYNDVQNGAWYVNFVETATKNNLCHGVGDNNFGVGLPITRQDMCVMIYNAIKDSNTLTGGEDTFVDGERIADYAKEAVLSLAKLDLVHGNDNKEFLPANNTTRAEAAVLLNSLKKHLEGGNN